MIWIIGMILVSYFVGIVSNFSGLVRTILCSAKSRKDAPVERFSSSILQVTCIFLLITFLVDSVLELSLALLRILIVFRFMISVI